jgi:hypothetical protein
MVKMRCLTPFPMGTRLPVGSRMYHFQFNARGHAVADVAEEDVGTILSIGAGYQVYDAAAATPSIDDQDDESDIMVEHTDAFLRPASSPPRGADAQASMAAPAFLQASSAVSVAGGEESK